MRCIVCQGCLAFHRSWRGVAASRGRPLRTVHRFLHDPRNILEGNWQSCRRATAATPNGSTTTSSTASAQFEVHMGPRREFAIFKGVQDEHRDHDSATTC